MNRLRNRLIAIFLAATLAPLAVTLWVTTSLLEQSLTYATTRQLDETSKALESTAREYYQRAREDLRAEVSSGRLAPERYGEAGRESWPAPIREFWASGQPERFVLAGSGGGRLDYLVRRAGDVWVYSRPLGGVRMDRLAEQYRRARAAVDLAAGRDLHRGFIYTFTLLAAGAWLAALGALIWSAHRVSRPIQQLTAALDALAAGDLRERVPAGRDDEIGRAMRAFNDMAAQLEHSRERILYLARVASWQAIARKMAHELKNSLTPIRLTVEEMVARAPSLEPAAQIIIDEVKALESRVRAFSEFAAEPAVRPAEFDVNAMVEERVALLQSAHPGVRCQLRLDAPPLVAFADPDLIRGVLTNLLENAAQAAGEILCRTGRASGGIAIEIHDSGPGLTAEARATLFEPTISFKKGGMGLGLSIARKSALLSGGDILLIEGELGGAAFRVLLPAPPCQPNAS